MFLEPLKNSLAYAFNLALIKDFLTGGEITLSHHQSILFSFFFFRMPVLQAAEEMLKDIDVNLSGRV